MNKKKEGDLTVLLFAILSFILAFITSKITRFSLMDMILVIILYFIIDIDYKLYNKGVDKG